MPLQVLPTKKFYIGKFGGSFVDLHRTKNYESQGSDRFLRRKASPFFGNGVGGGGGVESLYPCLPSFRQDRKNRPFYAIENGTGLPTSACQGPDGYARYVEYFNAGIDEYSDPFLNPSYEADYTAVNPVSGVRPWDIMSSKYAGNSYGLELGTDYETGYPLQVVASIEFGLAPDPLSDPEFYPDHKKMVKVYHRFIATQYSDNDELYPYIVTDQRNEKYINYLKLLSQRSQMNFWPGARIYLEIRHNLGGFYHYTAQNLQGWNIIKKKNSLIISRFISPHDSSVFNSSSYYYTGERAGPNIPRGRCSVSFYKPVS